jgi:hypothetical protein
MTCNLINEIFYNMHNSNNNCCMHIFAELEVQKNIIGSYMRTRDMDDAQGSYNHEDEIIGLHISLGNVETESNGHRSRVEPVELVETMRSLQKKCRAI